MNNTKGVSQNDLNNMINSTANKRIDYLRCKITGLEQEERMCHSRNDHGHGIELKLQIIRKREQIRQIEEWRRAGLVTPE